MKLTIFLIIVFSLRVSAGAYAQRVSLSLKDATLEKAFEEIRKQSPYDFVYHDKFIRLAHPITLDVKDIDIDEALQKLFAGQPFRYEVVNHIVTIQPRTSFPADSENLILAYTEVRGRVVDSLDQPLAGASVRVVNADGKRTALQTKTDRDGYFVLPNVPADAFLEITYVGYISRTIGAAMDVGVVVLKAMESELEEVEINAGYYTVKDRERTGSIVRVTAADIEKQPVLNPLEALKGRMAGVDIQQQHGEIGAGFTVRIRGQNSLRTADGVNDPLYLIDGVPFTSTTMQQPGGYFTTNPLNTLSPNDIASIEVLKDADATAIYGSRGANGVVLIATKRGQAGTARLTVDANFGSGRVRKFMDLLDTKQYLEMRREAYANNPSASISGNGARDLLVYDQNKYTDWQRKLLGGTANRLDTRASISGGSAGIRYLISGGLLKQGNVYPGDFGYQRGNGHAALTIGDEHDRLQTQLAITYSLDENDMPNSAINMTREALMLSPNAPDLLDDGGNINWIGTSYNNPMAYLKTPYNQQQRNSVVQATLSYQLAAGLRAKVAAGYNWIRMDEEQLTPASSLNPINATFNRVVWKWNRQVGWNVEPQLTYENRVGLGHLNMLLGGAIQQRDGRGQSYTATGFISEAMMHNHNMAATITAGSGVFSQYRYLSVFARANYALSDRYFINLTARRDGSSRFGPGNRWGNFGAVGAAWLFSEEAAVKVAIPWLTFGKLRASYGVTGSDRIDDYGFLATYTLSQARAYQIPYAFPSCLANADYRWESNRKLEAAVEFGVLDDHIRATVAWYRNRSGNQLVGYPLPAVTGFTSIQYNLPATVQNAGWELELNTVIGTVKKRMKSKEN